VERRLGLTSYRPPVSSRPYPLLGGSESDARPVLCGDARAEEIFIAELRNSRGASTVVAFSARARRYGSVRACAWEEIREITAADRWTIRSAVQRQRALSADPWQGYWRCRQGLTAAMRRLIGLKY
jgi:DNA primase